jgi:hypothetical protein
MRYYICINRHGLVIWQGHAKDLDEAWKLTCDEIRAPAGYQGGDDPAWRLQMVSWTK